MTCFLALIMGFEPHNLTLSKRMAGAWADMGQPMSSFYASSGLKIRPNFPTQDPALGDADFPGSMTIMRSGWGTANESAVFLLHGDSQHRPLHVPAWLAVDLLARRSGLHLVWCNVLRITERGLDPGRGAVYIFR